LPKLLRVSFYAWSTELPGTKMQYRRRGKLHHRMLHKEGNGEYKNKKLNKKKANAVAEAAGGSDTSAATPTVKESCNVMLVEEVEDTKLSTELNLMTRKFAKRELQGQMVNLQLAVAGGHILLQTREKEVTFQLQALQVLEAMMVKMITRDVTPVPFNPNNTYT
jgi:hypothetical protein